MHIHFQKSPVALAVIAALGASAAMTLTATAAEQAPGKYVAGDFHNHTTCSDGSISMQKLVKKATDTVDTPWGLDWFVQAGHGGNGNRNCTLVEDASLGTPAFPYVAGKGPTTTWANSIGAANIKGNGTGGTNMWRWQSLQEFQYPVMEYLNLLRNEPVFIGIESVVAGHEHTSMSVITGQIPASLSGVTLPASPPYIATGNANALAMWSYCFDRGDTDTSRGVANQWDCSVDDASATDPSWNATARKLIPAGGSGSGTRGHAKTVEALRWMAKYHPDASYYVPAHLERAGPFNPNGNNGFNIEHLRNFNNAAPGVAFGFETQPGHGASAERGEYRRNRNSIDGVLTDSVGGTTYGGTGIYGAQIGGVWDALLGEGRNWWFFASSDWHNRGSFGADDRRTTQDFLPGEYQRNYTFVRSDGKLNPQQIVDGLRTGNTFAASGQLIDRLSLVVCSAVSVNASAKGAANGKGRSNQSVEDIALEAATQNTTVDHPSCATMGQKLVVKPGVDVIVAIAVRDPVGKNYSPYSFPNPSLMQVGINRPIDEPVLDHIDLVRGRVLSLPKKPGDADYAGEWPRNANWLHADGTTENLSVVPAAAKNTTAAVAKTFSKVGWNEVTSDVDGTKFLTMSYRIPAVQYSQYVRLRGANLPAAVPFETDADGNPLPDLFSNASDRTMLRIPCTTVRSAGSQFDGCPDHLATASAGPINGQRAASYDVAAWADLWFYSNPVYVEVSGSTVVAGVK